MRIRRNGGHISIRDRVAPFWALGLFLLAGGLLAVAMPLGLATNAGDLEPWERLAGVGVGLGGAAGALWWLGQSPATQVQLDLTRRRLRLMRFGLSGRQIRSLSFDDLESVEVEHGTDGDGGTVWRPALRLRTGQLVLLSDYRTTQAAQIFVVRPRMWKSLAAATTSDDSGEWFNDL